LRNREIDRLYNRLSEEGKELADYIYETVEHLDELSDEEDRAAFSWVAARLERLSIEDRSLVSEISRIRGGM
jgi:succinate dehydrogenase flavin-adding protein (antitoxin of CptAB toxin-antitoxin module)